MKKLICALMLGASATAVAAGEWQARVERPAVGSMEQRAAAWHADSVMAMQVRYTSAPTAPAAVYGCQVYAPVRRAYRCAGWINITRPDTWATVRVTDGSGAALSSLVLNSADSAEGALTPGVWSRFELVCDPAGFPDADLSSITFEVLPQWNGGVAVVSDVAPLVMVDDVTVEAISQDGIYTDALLTDGDFEGWGFDRAVAGRHIYDNAAPLAAGEVLTVVAPSGVNGGVFNTLTFRALAPVGTTITVAPADGDPYTVATGEGSRWTGVCVPLSGMQPGATVRISADAACAIDDVRLVQGSDMEGIQPVSEILYVTSAANDGPGSLRQVVAEAPNCAEVVIAVNEISLSETVALGDKALIFSASADVESAVVRAPYGAPAFEFGPEREGVYAYFRGPITLVGGDVPVANGGLVSVSDSKGRFAGRVIADGLTFKDFKATGSGGAVYLNNPKVPASFRDCRFVGGAAANGAAIALTRGPELSVYGCEFTDCVTTGTTGGAVSIAGDYAPQATVLWSDFVRCTSTAGSGGAGAISVQGLTARVYVGRCVFDGCAGGRGAALSAYNGSRGTVTSTVTIAHCTAINCTGTSPALSVASSGSYKAPATALVNSIMAYNEGADIDAREGYLSGTNNIVEKSSVELPATIGTVSVFAVTDQTGRPQRDADGHYSIRADGPAYDAGIASYVAATGDETIDDRTLPAGNTEWERRSAAKGAPVRSIGACEYYDGTQGGFPMPSMYPQDIAIWPNPADATLNIVGDFDYVAISTLSGVTVYVGNSHSVDVSHLTSGMYIATFILPDGHSVAEKFIKK